MSVFRCFWVILYNWWFTEWLKPGVRVGGSLVCDSQCIMGVFSFTVLWNTHYRLLLEALGTWQINCLVQWKMQSFYKKIWSFVCSVFHCQFKYGLLAQVCFNDKGRKVKAAIQRELNIIKANNTPPSPISISSRLEIIIKPRTGCWQYSGSCTESHIQVIPVAKSL